MDPRLVHEQLTSSELTTGKPSVPSRIVLQRRGLMKRFRDDPKGALAVLQQEVVAGSAGPDELFALAELSFHHAQHGGGRPYDLAAATYAWAFLFPDVGGKPPQPYDPRLRLAADLYNRAVTSAFETKDGREVRSEERRVGKEGRSWGRTAR